MGKRRRERRTFLGRLRQVFLTGVVIITPLIITLWVLTILFDLIHGLSTPFILRILRILRVPLVDDPAFATYVVPLIGISATLLVIVLVGVVATNLLGRRFVAAFDQLMLRIPLIKGIYGGTRQLLDAFSMKTGGFQRVVAVEYPRPGIFTIGFVAREGATLMTQGRGHLPGLTLIFLPTTPNPTSGWLAAVPEKDIIPLDLTVEEGIKLVVSGGIVVPPGWETR
ncbi:MAG: DUF502 domain-containing protein [Acidobacteria bacterium]|nr:DUF502 domain-containing protein [Acidobacteriota bacterium]